LCLEVPKSNANIHVGAASQDPPEFALAVDVGHVLYILSEENRPIPSRQETDSMDDQQFREVLQYLGLSWKGYRRVRKGVKKRLIRHIQRLGCRSVEEYLVEFKSSKDARVECQRLMTVSISRFFRDLKLWQILEEQILPRFIESERGKIRVWSAGCACGEEVYSLKILWDHLSRSLSGAPDLEILATDMNPAYLGRANRGIFPSSSLREVTSGFRMAYFQGRPGKSKFSVIPPLREGIRWKVHNLLDDPPGFSFHLIFLRNSLLTYYEKEVRVDAFKRILDALSPGGFMAIGVHEVLPAEFPYLQPVCSLTYLFKKGKQPHS